ncbi:hypothetical protein QMK19_31865 [Streptomyces sp. H10-C2]|uniref:hypothetical protein n=1 Tax=unclassified Streptomyces TaxID=2593676 RepID=UPI0024BA2A0B|nr:MULTISPECIES: hypothetical protein [unclassified Streptomyces]MDJ0345140.1 hypothetical protein [Streptomyces sp. PH10-H1]MDJ0374108.1 hypothetical protein [Streptomyces sp. H10-C2]
MNRTQRLTLALAATATAGALTLATATASTAADLPPKPSDPGIPTSFDYRDCPELPSGADPAAWRCEVMVANIRIVTGKVPAVEVPLTVTHSEGPLPDGTTGQVFGAMHASPVAVPGIPGLKLQPEYAGNADFIGNGTIRGSIDIKIRLQHPGLRRTCAIGSDRAPVTVTSTAYGPTQWVSQNPPIIKGAMYDTTFAVPGVTGCGPAVDRLLDHWFALPSPSGANQFSLVGYYSFRTYAALNGSA